MNNRVKLYSIILFMLLLASCKSITSTDSDNGLDDSLDTVEEVEIIPGAGNVTLIVNKSNEAFFSLEFLEIEQNDLIENGKHEGWCIDWETPIESQNGTYPGIQLYSTFGVEKWKELNVLLTIKDELLSSDNSLTYREIQAVIWALRPRPAFDLNDIDIESLPQSMVRDGELLFDVPKVKELVEKVESSAKSFKYNDQTKFAIIAETPADVQTVITVGTKR